MRGHDFQDYGDLILLPYLGEEGYRAALLPMDYR